MLARAPETARQCVSRLPGPVHSLAPRLGHPGPVSAPARPRPWRARPRRRPRPSPARPVSPASRRAGVPGVPVSKSRRRPRPRGWRARPRRPARWRGAGVPGMASTSPVSKTPRPRPWRPCLEPGAAPYPPAPALASTSPASRPAGQPGQSRNAARPRQDLIHGNDEKIGATNHFPSTGGGPFGEDRPGAARKRPASARDGPSGLVIAGAGGIAFTGADTGRRGLASLASLERRGRYLFSRFRIGRGGPYAGPGQCIPSPA